MRLLRESDGLGDGFLTSNRSLVGPLITDHTLMSQPKQLLQRSKIPTTSLNLVMRSQGHGKIRKLDFLVTRHTSQKGVS